MNRLRIKRITKNALLKSVNARKDDYTPRASIYGDKLEKPIELLTNVVDDIKNMYSDSDMVDALDEIAGTIESALSMLKNIKRGLQ